MSTQRETGPAAKFIQICASQNDLFALDGEGSIFQYNFTARTWEKLVATRSLESPTRGDRASRGGPRPAGRRLSPAVHRGSTGFPQVPPTAWVRGSGRTGPRNGW